MLKFILPIMLLLTTNSISWNINILSMAFLMLGSLTLMKPEMWVSPLNWMMTPDFMSVTLILLTLWITPLMFLASQKLYMLNNNTTKFKMLVNLLTMILILAFALNNLFSFYILFEASLIPTLMIVLTWGYQPERIQAGMYLMMYTITGSLPLLIAIMYFNEINMSINMILPPYSHFYSSMMVWLIMNTAFMIKLPVFFTHLWLPKAHVEAPVAGSMILAAILLKLGGYGLLRMTTFLAPLMKLPTHFMMTMALWGGMITSMICVRQTDMKSLIAYSSVGHMSLVLGGILTNNSWGLWGALTMMIAHGLVSSSMFANANYMYEMTNSRNLFMNKGMNVILPSLSFIWFIMCIMNMAAPPSINLMAEIFLISAALSSFSMIIPLGIMSFLAAAYSLVLYTSINHGSYNMSTTLIAKYKMNKVVCFTMHLVPVMTMILAPSMVTIW